MNENIIVLTESGLAELVRTTAYDVVTDLYDRLTTFRALEIMTKDELAIYLRCDVSKINRYMKQGLPFEQFGKHPRFYKVDIDTWLRSSKGSPNGP